MLNKEESITLYEKIGEEIERARTQKLTQLKIAHSMDADDKYLLDSLDTILNNASRALKRAPSWLFGKKFIADDDSELRRFYHILYRHYDLIYFISNHPNFPLSSEQPLSVEDVDRFYAQTQSATESDYAIILHGETLYHYNKKHPTTRLIQITRDSGCLSDRNFWTSYSILVKYLKKCQPFHINMNNCGLHESIENCTDEIFLEQEISLDFDVLKSFICDIETCLDRRINEIHHQKLQTMLLMWFGLSLLAVGFALYFWAPVLLQNLAWSAVAIGYVSATLPIIGEIVAGLTIMCALKAGATATAQEQLENLSNKLKNVPTQDTSHHRRQARNTVNLNQFFNHNEHKLRVLLAEQNSQGAGNAAHQMALS